VPDKIFVFLYKNNRNPTGISNPKGVLFGWFLPRSNTKCETPPFRPSNESIPVLGLVVGAHEDSQHLLRRILPKATVRAFRILLQKNQHFVKENCTDILYKKVNAKGWLHIVHCIAFYPIVWSRVAHWVCPKVFKGCKFEELQPKFKKKSAALCPGSSASKKGE
jgi:hypothetical protein